MKVWVASNLTARQIATEVATIDRLPHTSGYEIDSFSGQVATIPVEDAKEAKLLIDKLAKRLLDRVEWDAFGLQDDDGTEWYCSTCGEDIDGCQCHTVEEGS